MIRLPLRVLQLTSTSLMGGTEQMVLQLVQHADPARMKVEVLSLMGPGDLTRRAAALGTRAVNWGLARLADPRLPLRVRRFLREGRYDVVHCYGLRAELLTRPVARRAGAVCISSISSPDPWRRWHHTLLDRLTSGGVTFWIAVCDAARRTRISREQFPTERMMVVYNGLPDAPPPGEAERRAARARLGLASGPSGAPGPPGPPVLAVVGNLREAKGYPDLIEAMALLVKEHPAIVCLCAGRDDSGGAIPALAEGRGLSRALRWLGFVDGVDEVDGVDKMDRIYAAADVVVSASHWEGCPINILEAMRAARPIVATRVGGVPELIDDRREGLLVPAREPAALAKAISSLLAAPDECAALGAAARARFLRQFTVERMVAEHTRIYELAVAEERGIQMSPDGRSGE